MAASETCGTRGSLADCSAMFKDNRLRKKYAHSGTHSWNGVGTLLMVVE